MENKNEKLPIQNEFQIIFDKLEEAKKEHRILFDVNATGASLSESIKGIKDIVDSYNTIQQYTTITRI